MATTLDPYRISQLEAGKRPGYDAIFNSTSQDDIVKAMKQWGSKRVFLVHSKTLATQTNYIDRLKDVLGDSLIAIKDGVGAHSPYADIIDISNVIAEKGVDCVVCVGSGSYSDACKTARLLSATLPPGFGEQEMEELVDAATGLSPEELMKKPIGIKLILVPTSLSAGEWNHLASCTNSAGKKQHFGREDGCAADLVLMDPWLAMTAPEKLWLSSGMRAVDHCIETLCSPKISDHPDAFQWCETALRHLSKGLAFYKEGLGKDEAKLVEGISDCQAGSRMSLMSFIIYRIPMGASHAIGHQLGSVAGVMHGITSCVMLPAVLRFTKGKTVDAQARIVQIFNESMGWNESDAADCVARLVQLLGLPGSLKEVGVASTSQMEQIIDQTMTDVLFALGLVSSRKDISEIVYLAK